MTEQNYEDAIAELGRTDGMDAETVAALERRLLQAFTDHHSTRVTAGTDDVRPDAPGTSGSHAWRRWGAAAAVFVVVVGGMAGWRALRRTPPVPEVRQAVAGSGASSGYARRDDRETRPAGGSA